MLADDSCVKITKLALNHFLYAAIRMALTPRLCVVFEDAGAGITAAKVLEMNTMGIGPAKRVGSADYIYYSVFDPRLEDII